MDSSRLSPPQINGQELSPASSRKENIAPCQVLLFNHLKMVLKKSNCEVNSGNTMRPRYFNSLCKPKKSAEHWIIKFFLNSVNQSVDFKCQNQKKPVNVKWQNEEILAISAEYIEDGDMEILKDLRHPIVFSMNKYKRWLFPDVLKNNILNESLQNESFKVTLFEYEQHGPGDLYGKSRSRCVGHMDSHMYVENWDLSDGHDKRQVKNGSRLKPSRRRKYHNQHKWGIQRLEKKITVSKQEVTASRKKNSPELPGCPEIRYEVIRPADYNSSKVNYRHYYSKKWSYWYPSPSGRSLRKTKLGHKLSFIDKVWGYNVKDIHEDTELEKKYPGGKGEEWMWQVEYEETKTRETTWKVPFKNLIVKKHHFKRRRKIKKSKNHIGLDEGAYVFVDVENKVQVKVKVKQVNRASSRWTKKYPKGCILVDRIQDIEEKTEEDFVVVENTNKKSDKSEEIQESLKEGINAFNDSFCVCKVFMSEIMPRKLVEVCGTEAQVGLIHPYTFVLDLYPWNLVCQISPGLGLWPDPESQNVVSVRILLQGGSTESFQKITSLHRAVGEDRERVYTLTQLGDVVCRVRKEVDATQSSQPRKTQSQISVQKTVFQQLFADLTMVKTARNIHLDFLHSGKVLPSVAKINILDLIDLDLGLVEECSICLASWDGDKWSWVSHNMTLLPCQHSFCRQCWQMYLCHNIKQGKTTLLCMEYGCETEIDATTVASLVPPALLTRWQKQCDERYVMEDGGWEWCPRPDCTYLAKRVKSQFTKSQVQTQYGFSVRCPCGQLWCFLCKKDPHWPALCGHSNTYHKMLIKKVNVKRCPQCKHPMEMYGNCRHVRCRCSFDFCWDCLQEWNNHTINSHRCGEITKEETTMKLDTSVTHSVAMSYYKESVTHRHAWQHLSMTVIRRQASQFQTLQRSTQHWARNLTSVSEPDPTQTFVKNTLMFVREVHMLLENCSVLLSNTTRACRPQNLVACRTQLAFINSRIEATLKMPKGQQDKMLTRLKSLKYMAWSTIDRMVLLISGAQAAIDNYAKQNGQETDKHESGGDN